jgi:hypothetical protein
VRLRYVPRHLLIFSAHVVGLHGRYMSKGSSGESGLTLIEFVAALGVTSLATLALCAFLRSSNGIFQHTITGLKERLALSTLEAALLSGVRANDSSRLSFSFLVSHGVTPLQNGSSHPLNTLRGQSAPRRDSDITSFIELAPTYAGVITSSSSSSLSVTLTACNFISRPTSSRFKSFVALGVSGAVQLVGTVGTSSTGCILFQGEAIAGMVSDPRLVLPSSLHRFIPVAQEYSLFIDSTGQLRIASHTGLRVLENQPLTSGLASMQLSPLATPHGPVGYALSARSTHDIHLTTVLPLALMPHEVWRHIF